MAELLRVAPVERMDLGEGAWVELKTRLSFVERNRLAAAAIQTTVQEAPNGELVTVNDVNVEGAVRAALEIGIVAWSFEDPVTPENVALLDEDSGDRVKRRLDQLWARRTDDDRKNSSSGGAPRSRGRQSTTRRS